MLVEPSEGVEVCKVEFTCDKHNLVNGAKFYMKNTTESAMSSCVDLSQEYDSERTKLFKIPFDVRFFDYQGNINRLNDPKKNQIGNDLMFNLALQVYFHPMPFHNDGFNFKLYIQQECKFLHKAWFNLGFYISASKLKTADGKKTID